MSEINAAGSIPTRYKPALKVLAVLTATAFILLNNTLFAQKAAPAPYYPTHEEILQRYIDGAHMDSITRNKVYNAHIQAHWLADGTGFWYQRQLAGDKTDYRYVNCRDGQNASAFNQQRLAHLLSEKTHKDLPAVYRDVILTGPWSSRVQHSGYSRH